MNVVASELGIVSDKIAKLRVESIHLFKGSKQEPLLNLSQRQDSQDLIFLFHSLFIQTHIHTFSLSPFLSLPFSLSLSLSPFLSLTLSLSLSFRILHFQKLVYLL